MKNERLPGMSSEKNQELSSALDELRDVRCRRMDYTKKEVEAQNKVLALMHEHKLKEYHDDDYDPPLDAQIVAGKDKVKIKLGGEDEETP